MAQKQHSQRLGIENGFSKNNDFQDLNVIINRRTMVIPSSFLHNSLIQSIKKAMDIMDQEFRYVFENVKKNRYDKNGVFTC